MGIIQLNHSQIQYNMEFLSDRIIATLDKDTGLKALTFSSSGLIALLEPWASENNYRIITPMRSDFVQISLIAGSKGSLSVRGLISGNVDRGPTSTIVLYDLIPEPYQVKVTDQSVRYIPIFEK